MFGALFSSTKRKQSYTFVFAAPFLTISLSKETGNCPLIVLNTRRPAGWTGYLSTNGVEHRLLHYVYAQTAARKCLTLSNFLRSPAIALRYPKLALPFCLGIAVSKTFGTWYAPKSSSAGCYCVTSIFEVHENNDRELLTWKGSLSSTCTRQQSADQGHASYRT